MLLSIVMGTARCTNTWRPTRHEGVVGSEPHVVYRVLANCGHGRRVGRLPTLQVDRKKEIDRKGVGVGGIAVKEQLCSKDIELTGVIPPANSEVLIRVQAAETAPQRTETIEQET